ncbi:MAG: hypothetical protein ACOCM4_09675 [Acetivibrio ethanolgignens]
MRPTFKLNGNDYSFKINKHSLSISYTPVEGPNSGTMLDGTKVIDLMGYRTIININTNAMNQEDINAILAELLNPYVEVTYYDPKDKAERTSTFIPQVGSIPVAMYKGSNLVYYNEVSIVLEERSLHE